MQTYSLIEYNCDICGDRVLSDRDMMFCLICNKKICDFDNIHGLCPEHWGNLTKKARFRFLNIEYRELQKEIRIKNVLGLLSGFLFPIIFTAFITMNEFFIGISIILAFSLIGFRIITHYDRINSNDSIRKKKMRVLKKSK